jgi:hypothetical protein
VSAKDLEALAQRKSFHRQAFIQRDDLLGARWWFDGMESASTFTPSRRSALKFLLGMGGIVGAGLVLRAGCHALTDEPAVTMDALDLQRKEGWSVGATGAALPFPDSMRTDSAGNSNFAASLASLGRDLAPHDPRLDPYAVSTLFDVLDNPRGAGLVSMIKPMHNAIMDVTNHAAQALASLFASEEDRKQTALILDLPGPESVAAAAGVAAVFAPVFLYDNWPHPLGVVPSHHVLAAALYYRPDLLSAQTQRAAPIPPAFVLDARRLAPYRDESDRFDNRYLARMPGADGFVRLGIQRVLYVTAQSEAHEQDDLNDDFVALRDKGIDVKMVALSDFAPASEQVLREQNAPITDRTYYYGGHPHGSFFFWSSYHWYSPSTSGRTYSGNLPRPVSTGRTFTPAARPTLFSSRSIGGLSGVGKQKPSGFGRVSYRSGSGSIGRSGSFGRTGSSSFG